jgi:coniferyl-aldehyde dehydrogenase
MNAQTDKPIETLSHLEGQQSLTLDELFKRSQQFYAKNTYPKLEQRLERISTLKHNLLANKDELIAALSEDYGHRSEFDSLMADIMPSIQQAKFTKKKLHRWMKADKRHAGLMFTPSKVEVAYQPLGVVGIISPWNFPVILAISPAITAMAAGNTVMIKLSEFTPRTNVAMRALFKGLEDVVCLVEGGPNVASEFSALPFDHLLFTGSTAVGKLVAKAAAENLTPVTLELGGKSPAIVTDKGKLETAVDSLLFGKCLNGGQICVSPDYVLIHESLESRFIEKIKQRYIEVMGQEGELTAIINQRQWERLQSYLLDAEQKGAELIHLEAPIANKHQPYLMQPTVLRGVNDDMSVMQDEIFGPLLPVLTYRDLSEALKYINQRPRPLALYLFSDDSKEQKQVVQGTHSGGMAINDSVMHVALEDAPFGGVGPSGMGHYHGVEGFKTFSKAKTIMKTPSWLPRTALLLKHKKLTASLFSRLFVR